MIFFIGVMIFSGVKIFIWVKENHKTEELQEKVNRSVSVDEGKEDGDEERYLVDFESLKKINDDIVGWIKVNGTDVQMAVVQGNDNSYYLTHSLDKSYSSAGWAFVDYSNKLDGSDKNIVIYGHNRRDSSIFGTLKNVLNSDWYNDENNRYVYFVTENESKVYEVFSVYKIEEEAYYIKTQFNQNDFGEFVNKMKSRSVKDFGIEVSEDDSILTLSTCDDNNKYRVVLQAVLRNNE